MDKRQTSFDFPDEPKAPPVTEPKPKVMICRQSTSICSYCGRRMPAGMLAGHWPADDQRWVMTAPYHAEDCRWISTKGLTATATDSQ